MINIVESTIKNISNCSYEHMQDINLEELKQILLNDNSDVEI